jgi:exopolysaccharide biosynthesis polyprenyl glycosylphosphotransferase
MIASVGRSSRRTSRDVVADRMATASHAEGLTGPFGRNGARSSRPTVRRAVTLLRACRYIDPILVLLALLTVFLATNATHVGDIGLGAFLEMRVTIKNLLLLVAFAGGVQLSLGMFGLYDDRAATQPAEYTLRLIAACLLGCLPILLFPLASRTGMFRLSTVASVVVVAVTMLVLLRVVVWVGAAAPQAAANRREVLIVGSGPRALTLYRELYADDSDQVRVHGFVDSASGPWADESARRRVAVLEDLESYLMGHPIDDVLITLPIKSCYGQIQQTIALCERLGVRAAYLADVFQSSLARPTLEETGGFPIVRMHVVTDDHRMLVKRAIDIVVAGLGLAVLSPVFLIIAVAIRATTPGPVIFGQERYGLNKRRFRMYKFRTMVVNAEALQPMLESRNEATGPVFKIRNDPRVTRVGAVLRKTSLDELPQLLNVLRGDMSLVGPRPLPPRDVHRFSESWLMRRFSVPPGVTGLWQVSGRSDLPFARWVALDLEYIDGWSLGLDLKILAMTLPAVLKGRGAA